MILYQTDKHSIVIRSFATVKSIEEIEIKKNEYWILSDKVIRVGEQLTGECVLVKPMVAIPV
jgi:hypothetical protein